MRESTRSFGEVLRRLRSAAALSQEELAERAGLSRSGISHLERGLHPTPRLETVRMLADALRLGEADRAALLAAARPTLWQTTPVPDPDRRPAFGPTRITGLGGRESAGATLPVPSTRYAKSGGLSIAYHVFGDGPHDLVWVPGYISQVEHYWKLPAMATLLRRLAATARVLLIDKRGTGMSDRPGRISTLEERMDDIRAVMDACRSERAVVAGVSVGVPVGILFAATYPQRTQSLILYGGSATYVQQPDYPWAAPRERQRQAIDAAAASLHQIWGTLAYAREEIRLWGAPSQADDEELVTWFAELMRLGASPGDEIARQRMNLEVDVRHLLPAIRVPTLVLHRTGDRGFRIEEGRYLAGHIPGAIFTELPGDDHLVWVGDQEPLLAAIERFIAASATDAPVEARDSVLATVVHVACEETAAPEFAAVVTQACNRFRGQRVTPPGRGIDAIFDGPARAVRFAQAVCEAMAGRGAVVRAGIQTGEITIGAGTVGGAPVDTARALAARAQPGEVLATHIVRDLVAGSGIPFAHATATEADALADVSEVLVVELTR
jgi:pimeloyl-ACP methyl ester carboxylesterase/transcriptional regulator with XRE-family HTH domain